MNLFEYEGKGIMKQFDIPVPNSVLIVSDQEDAPMEFPFVLKAQVLTGGRGKAGGVKVCEKVEQYKEYVREILHMTIKGHQVHGVLAEEMVKPEAELYISITLQGVSVPTLIASKFGGMDIEQVAKEHPEEIVKISIDPFIGLKDYQIKYLAEKLEIEDTVDFTMLVRKLETAFFETKAMLIEINPLGIVEKKLIAMDSKVVIDGHAYSMKDTMEALEKDRDQLYGYEKPEEEKTTVTFVPLDGNVGLISDGAGTGMLTLDLLREAGIEIASFGELGGMTTPEVMYRALELTFSNNPEVKALFIVLIGGFNRMDNMAKGITTYMEDHQVKIPVYCRMCGTMQEEGIQIMKEYGLTTYDVLSDAVEALTVSMKGGD